MNDLETTGRKIARALIAHGTDTIFGIPGAHMYDFNDALYSERDRLRFIGTRHEQGAAYMAYGYAKSSGRPGVYTVVPGPGVLNSGAALCTALGANTPVFCVTGNIMSHLIGRGRGQLHELPDQLATLRGITKGAERIAHPSETYRTMAGLFTRMQSGRQGPVAVEAPWDVFGKSGVAEAPIIGVPAPPPAPDSDAIERAAKLIARARNPLIMVGGGAVDAATEILALAERIGAPVTSHRSGRGVIPDDSPYSLDLVAAYDYWRSVDVLIGIGSRLELQYMRWTWQPPGLEIVRIDIDPTEMTRVVPTVGIVSDAAEGTRALLDALPTTGAASGTGDTGDTDRTAASATPRSGYRTEKFDALRIKARAAMQVVQPQMSYLDAIRDVLPRDGFFVEEITQMGFTARFGFPVYGPRQYVTCGYQDNLGFGFNTALGVKVAHPDRAVVSISGDGGFLFGVQELATAVQHRIAVVAIVFNNGAYGNVRRDQRQRYHEHYLGCDLVNPDFVKLAESFGVRSFRAMNPAELRTALSQALALDAPAVIEVPVATDSEVSPWQFLHPGPPEV